MNCTMNAATKSTIVTTADRVILPRVRMLTCPMIEATVTRPTTVYERRLPLKKIF